MRQVSSGIAAPRLSHARRTQPTGEGSRSRSQNRFENSLPHPLTRQVRIRPRTPAIRCTSSLFGKHGGTAWSRRSRRTRVKAWWINEQCSSCSATTSDVDAATCSACGEPLLRPVVKENGSWRLVKGFHTSSYTRMKADAPASTITTASGHVGSDKTIHPWENRLLSPYECAYIQTLPSDFKWGDALQRWGHTNLREMIGEAVPPRFTEMHGLSILAFLDADFETPLLPENDTRVVKASKLLDKARSKAHGEFVEA